MKTLTKNNIITLQEALIEQFGGAFGIRDEGMLESALQAPFQTFDGKDLYPTIIEKATRLGYSLIKNHPFLDGNKRIGAHSMLVFLEINHIEIECKDKELIDLILGIASGEKSEENLLFWLQNHIK